MMNDISVPVEYKELDTLLSFMDDALLGWRCPTILRLRCLMVTEELFDAAYLVPGVEKELVCAAGAVPGTFRLSLYSDGKPAGGPHSDLSIFMSLNCTKGILLRWENLSAVVLEIARQP